MVYTWQSKQLQNKKSDGTQTTAVLITVYGVLFPVPLGWPLALFIMGYVDLELEITDPLKVAFMKILDHTGIKFSR